MVLLLLVWQQRRGWLLHRWSVFRVIDDRHHPVSGIGDQGLLVIVPGVAILQSVAASAAVSSAVVTIVVERVAVLVQVVVVSVGRTVAYSADSATALTFVRVAFGRASLAARAAQRRGGRQQTLPGVLVLVALQVVRGETGLVAAGRLRVPREQRHRAQRQQASAKPQRSFQQHGRGGRGRRRADDGTTGSRADAARIPARGTHDGHAARGMDDCVPESPPLPPPPPRAVLRCRWCGVAVVPRATGDFPSASSPSAPVPVLVGVLPATIAETAGGPGVCAAGNGTGVGVREKNAAPVVGGGGRWRDDPRKTRVAVSTDVLRSARGRRVRVARLSARSECVGLNGRSARLRSAECWCVRDARVCVAPCCRQAAGPHTHTYTPYSYATSLKIARLRCARAAPAG